MVITTFDEVYEVYLDRITTYKLKELTEDERYEDLKLKLKMAFARFTNIAEVNVDYTLRTFSRDLSLNEIDILSYFMIGEWLSPIVLSEETLKNRLKSRDYEVHSPANLLAQLLSVKKSCENEANRLMNKYGYLTKYLNKRSDI